MKTMQCGTRWAGMGMLLAVFGMLGCAKERPLTGSGMGLSTGALYRTAEARVLETDRVIAPECVERRVVFTEVVEEPIVAATPRTTVQDSYAWPVSGQSQQVAPRSRDKVTRYSRFVERWVVRRCGERVTYLVTFIPTADGEEIEVVLEGGRE